MVSAKLLTSEKAFTVPSFFEDVDADNFLVLGSAPRFDIDVLVVEWFVDQHETDGWLAGDIPL